MRWPGSRGLMALFDPVITIKTGISLAADHGTLTSCSVKRRGRSTSTAGKDSEHETAWGPGQRRRRALGVEARGRAVGAVLANLVNNLPATLILIPVTAALGAGPVLATLVGVNVGPNLTQVGSLATLLWRRVLPGLTGELLHRAGPAGRHEPAAHRGRTRRLAGAVPDPAGPAPGIALDPADPGGR